MYYSILSSFALCLLIISLVYESCLAAHYIKSLCVFMNCVFALYDTVLNRNVYTYML